MSNLVTLKFKRCSLRKHPTAQEFLLWGVLKNKQLGYKFRRQHSLGNYIVDFYCPDRKLILEIDGSQHITQKNYDEQRSKFFKVNGLRVLRFWNNEVDNNMEGVIDRIKEYLR